MDAGMQLELLLCLFFQQKGSHLIVYAVTLAKGVFGTAERGLPLSEYWRVQQQLMDLIFKLSGN